MFLSQLWLQANINFLKSANITQHEICLTVSIRFVSNMADVNLLAPAGVRYHFDIKSALIILRIVNSLNAVMKNYNLYTAISSSAFRKAVFYPRYNKWNKVFV